MRFTCCVLNLFEKVDLLPWLNFPFLYPLKTLENLKFSDIFRRYKSGTWVGNGLNWLFATYFSLYFLDLIHGLLNHTGVQSEKSIQNWWMLNYTNFPTNSTNADFHNMFFLKMTGNLLDVKNNTIIIIKKKSVKNFSFMVKKD